MPLSADAIDALDIEPIQSPRLSPQEIDAIGAAPASGALRRYVADPAISLAKGIVGVPEAIVGLADIPTFGAVGKVLEAGGYGFQPKFTKEWLTQFESPETLAARERVSKAEGFFPKVAAAVQNPSSIASTVVESVPSMLGGAAIGRKILTSLPKLGAIVGAATGEGAISAGQTAEQLRQESESGFLTPKKAALSLTTGAVTGLLGVTGGALARRLGIQDVDTLLSRGTSEATKKNILRRVAEGAVVEGAFEELPQSAQEQWQHNIASGKPWSEGVADAAALGMLAGGFVGGLANAVSGRPPPAPESKTDETIPSPRVAETESEIQASDKIPLVQSVTPQPAPEEETTPRITQPSRSREVSPADIAREIGFDFNPTPQIGAISLEGLTAEERTRLESQLPKQWEFTDRRPDSPTAGLTFYVPEGSTRDAVVKRLQEKLSEAPSTQAQTGKPVASVGVPALTSGGTTPATAENVDKPNQPFPELTPGEQAKQRAQSRRLVEERYRFASPEVLSQQLAEFDEKFPTSTTQPETKPGAPVAKQTPATTVAETSGEMKVKAVKPQQVFVVATNSHRQVQRLERSVSVARGGLPVSLGSKARTWEIPDTPKNRAAVAKLGFKIRTQDTKRVNERRERYAAEIAAQTPEPPVDLFPDLKDKAPTLERVRRAIVEAESDLKTKLEAASDENIRSDHPIHAEVDLAQRRVDKLREIGQRLEKESVTAAKAEPAPEANLAERAIAGIEDLQKKLRGSGADVSMGVPKSILDLALEVARLSLKAGNTTYQAIDAAIAYIRSKVGGSFDETKARENLDIALTEADPTSGTVIDPATGTRIANAEGDGDVVNIAGNEFNIVAKERLTPEQKAAGDARVQDYFGKEVKLPGVPDRSQGKLRGSTDTNVVFKITPDGKNHDAAGELLLAHLIEQIQMQHQPGGDPAYVSSLVNAINKNFNTGNLAGVFSDGMLDRLVSVSVSESSWRGTMLRAVTGITEDMVTVARNAKFFLRRTYENMFGGDLVRKIMDKIALNFRERFTGEEIERLYNENPILQELFLKVVSRLRVKPSLTSVIQEIFNTRVDRQADIVEKFVDTMVNKFSATPEEAARLKAEFSNTFVSSFKAAREKAQAKALAALTPEERKIIGPTTPLWKKLTNLVNSGWLDSAKVVEEYAKSKGMVVPTEQELERMRNWSIKEQSLREPSAREIAANDGDVDKAAAKVASATLEARQDLLRKMNTQWSRWTHPIMRSLKDITDPIKRYNTAMAANEWLTANLLLKVGFGSRQLLDIATQMVLHTPTRAAQYAFEQWDNDRSAGRDSNLLHNLSQAMADAYRTRIKVIGDTLASFRRTLAGRGEQKNVEQLLSSISVFDRALLRADEMKAEGKPAAARFLTMLALTMRFGRQFAAAADVIQGVPAEAQEMAHQIRTGLREQGKGKLEQEVEFNTILGLLTTARAESLSEARQILESRGLETHNAAVQRAAWHILREKIYHMAKNAGLPADEWKVQNHYYRNVIGWNEPESQGFGGIGGPGGLVAMTAKAGKEVLSRAGIPAFPFVFGNAMGISLNRKLSYTPLGFFPGFFKGSPWFEGERNQRQRKIEATIGTTIGSTIFTLAALGIWVVLPRKWPEDEKEKARWTANGWSPGMLIVPIGDDKEQKISTRVGPMALLSPYLAAGGALHDANVQHAKKQEEINQKAAKLGLQPEQLKGLDANQWLNVIGSAAWASAAGGRTASGMLGSYTDFGNFSAKKSSASATITLIPGLPGFQELSRMAGSNINPKLASFWDLLVPLPTSDAARVNMLGDPMRNENDVERVFQVLSGGTAPLPTNKEAFKKNQAYTNLFESDYRPPSINPAKGYQFGNQLRPMTEPELHRYTAERGQRFSIELQNVNLDGLSPTAAKATVERAFQRANASALQSIGATVPSRRASVAATSILSTPAIYRTSSPARRSYGRIRSSFGSRKRLTVGRVRRSLSLKVPRLKRSRIRGVSSRRKGYGRVRSMRRKIYA